MIVWFAALLILAALTALGAVAVTAKSTALALSAEGMARVIAIAAFFAGAIIVVPHHKSLFDDFGLDLSAASVLVISVCDLVLKYWYAFAGLVPLLLAGDCLLFFLLHRNSETRPCARLLSGAVSIVILLMFVMSSAAILLPMLSVTRDLS